MVQPATSSPQPTLDTIEVIPEPMASNQSSLLWRRLGAWSAEMGLILASGLLPFGLGLAVANQSRQVPLNPVLDQVQPALARVVGQPKYQLRQTVSPLTNLLWSVALLAPVAVLGRHIHQLAKTGQSFPKRWLQLRLMPFQGEALTYRQVLLREGGRWGGPLLLAGGLGLASGAGLPGLWLPLTLGLCGLGSGATSLLNGDRRAWYDRLAGTWVFGTRPDDVAQTYAVNPADIFDLSSVLSPDQVLLLNGESGNAADAQEAVVFTDAGGGLTTLVLMPAVSPSPLARLRLGFGSRVAGGALLLGGLVVGTQMLTQHQLTRQVTAIQSDEQFLAFVKTLLETPAGSAKHQAAILALAQVDDPRTANYLADLLTQVSDPATLATLEQALVSQGLSGLPRLQQLNQSLRTDLLLSQDRAATDSLRQRQRTVQAAIAKLLLLHSGQLTGLSFDKIDLSADGSGLFQLYLPALKAAGTEWRSAVLAQANFASAEFFAAGPDGQSGTYDDQVSDFSGADLKEANLSSANLRAAQLVNTSLLRADLTQSTLTQANLTRSNLTGARLIGINLSEAQLPDSNLVGADLTRATLIEANLAGARLSRVEAADSRWEAADLSRTEWVDANLTQTDFSRANLNFANLQGANLRHSNLSGAQLRQASLQNADLTGVSLSGANLTGVDFQDARFSDRAASASESFISQAPQVEDSDQLRGVDFSRAVNLDTRQLTYICAQGGLHPACQPR